MIEVTFQTMININGSMLAYDNTVSTDKTEAEIVKALKKAGVSEFTGSNYENSTYQTMPGRVFVKLQNTAIAERTQAQFALTSE